MNNSYQTHTHLRRTSIACPGVVYVCIISGTTTPTAMAGDPGTEEATEDVAISKARIAQVAAPLDIYALKTGLRLQAFVSAVFFSAKHVFETVLIKALDVFPVGKVSLVPVYYAYIIP